MKRKLMYDTYITIVLFVLIAATLIYNYLFRSGDKVERLFLIAGTIIAVRVVFKKTFLKKSKAAYISILCFIMLAMYFGNVLSFYTYIPHYDKVLHFISGMIIGILGLIIYSYFTKENIENMNVKFSVFFLFIFITSLAGIWEIWEFSTDKIFGLNSQFNSLNDTMTDIIAGTVGGLITLVYVYIFGIKRKSKFLMKILEEVI